MIPVGVLAGSASGGGAVTLVQYEAASTQTGTTAFESSALSSAQVGDYVVVFLKSSANRTFTISGGGVTTWTKHLDNLNPPGYAHMWGGFITSDPTSATVSITASGTGYRDTCYVVLRGVNTTTPLTIPSPTSQTADPFTVTGPTTTVDGQYAYVPIVMLDDNDPTLSSFTGWTELARLSVRSTNQATVVAGKPMPNAGASGSFDVDQTFSPTDTSYYWPIIVNAAA